MTSAPHTQCQPDEAESLPDRLRDWGHPDWYYATTDLLSDNEDVRREAACHIEMQDTEIAALKSRVEELTKALQDAKLMFGAIYELIDDEEMAEPLDYAIAHA